MKNLIYLLVIIPVFLFSWKSEAQTMTNQQDTVINTELSRANSFAKQGKTEEALEIYIEIIESHPENLEAVQGWLMLNLNMIKGEKGPESAIKLLEQLEKQYPQNTGIRFWKAFIFASSGRNEEALKYAEKLIGMYPGESLNYILKGQALSALGRDQEAFEAFDRATSLDPSRYDVWLMKANSLKKTGKLDEAIISVNKGLDVAPDNPNCFFVRAGIYNLKGDKTNALADLKKAIGMNPVFKKTAPLNMDFKTLCDDEEFKKLTFVITVGQKAPDFTLNDLKGKPVSLSSMIGAKLLLIDFWAGWCAPCRKENPNLLRVYNEYNRMGFEVIGVSLDRTKDVWIKAVNDDKLPWTQVSDLNYFNSEVAKQYDVVSIPSNFLLDEKGTIIAMNLRGETLYNRIKGFLLPETVTDADGNVYKTVTIGKQVWMAENLRTTKYRNGDPIQFVTDSAAWKKAAQGAYCYYDNNSINGDKYGLLYNWNAVNNPAKIAPEGWHVPTDEEWKVLVNYLGGPRIAGGKLKESGKTHWESPNAGATNESGFTALPGGICVYSFLSHSIGRQGSWWTTTEIEKGKFASYLIRNTSSGILIEQFGKYTGRSIRCIKD